MAEWLFLCWGEGTSHAQALGSSNKPTEEVTPFAKASRGKSSLSSAVLVETQGVLMEWSQTSWAGLYSALLPLHVWGYSKFHQISRVYCSSGGFTNLCLEAELLFFLSVWALRCTNAALAARLSLSLLMQAQWGEQITAPLAGQALLTQRCSGFTQRPPSEPSPGVQRHLAEGPTLISGALLCPGCTQHPGASAESTGQEKSLRKRKSLQIRPWEQHLVYGRDRFNLLSGRLNCRISRMLIN